MAICYLQVSLARIIAKNAPEWWIITLGLAAAFVSGVLFPAFAIFFGELLDVLLLPPGEVLDGVHLWAGLFIVLAVVSGLSNFLKVSFSYAKPVQGFIEDITGSPYESLTIFHSNPE